MPLRWIEYRIMIKEYKNQCPIIVERFSQDSVCTLSRIYFDDMVFYGLEPSEPIVEDGIYHLTLTRSPRFSGLYPYNQLHDSKVPLINGVNGHSGVRIHVGNYPSDTDGCLLVGDSCSHAFVSHSVKAYTELLSKMVEIEKVNPNVFYVIKFVSKYE